WFRAREVVVRVPDDDAASSGLGKYSVPRDAFADGLDLVLSIGGDARMLYTVQLVYPAPVPIIGVNAGRLGYLSEMEPGELDTLLPRLVAGGVKVAARMGVGVEIEAGGAEPHTRFALNEAALEKQR